MSSEDIVPFLELDEVSLRELIPQGVVRNYPKDSVILHAGDLSHSLYVILSGRVKVFIADDSGKEYVLSTIGAGDYFGEVALDGGPRSASVMTEEACRLFVIPKVEVKTLIESHPDFARNLIGRLIRKIRSLSDSVHNLALLSVYCRLLKFIKEHARTRNDGVCATDRFTQTDIAARIGASREMVSRILTDLCNCGYISIVGKRIVVHRELPDHA